MGVSHGLVGVFFAFLLSLSLFSLLAASCLPPVYLSVAGGVLLFTSNYVLFSTC